MSRHGLWSRAAIHGAKVPEDVGASPSMGGPSYMGLRRLICWVVAGGHTGLICCGRWAHSVLGWAIHGCGAWARRTMGEAHQRKVPEHMLCDVTCVWLVDVASGKRKLSLGADSRAAGC